HDAALVGRQHVVANAVDADERALGQVDELLGVLGLVLVADQAAVHVHALAGEDVLLDVAAAGVLAVADDRHARVGGGHPRPLDHLAVVLPRPVPGGDLGAPGRHAGFAVR